MTKYWPQIAKWGCGALLSVLTYFSLLYIGRVDALTLQVERDKTMLEKIQQDVEWLRNHWGDR